MMKRIKNIVTLSRSVENEAVTSQDVEQFDRDRHGPITDGLDLLKHQLDIEIQKRESYTAAIRTAENNIAYLRQARTDSAKLCKSLEELVKSIEENPPREQK